MVVCLPDAVAAGVVAGLALGVVLGAIAAVALLRYLDGGGLARPSCDESPSREAKQRPPRGSPMLLARWLAAAVCVVAACAAASLYGRAVLRGGRAGGALSLLMPRGLGLAAGGGSPGGGPSGAGEGPLAPVPPLPCDPLSPFRHSDLPPEPRHVRANHSLTGKSLYVTVLTASHIDALIENWPSQEEHLYAPFDSHFLLAVPARDADKVLFAVTQRMGWEKVMDFTAPQLAYECDGARDMVTYPAQGWYRSPRHVTVLVVVRNFRLPEHIRTATHEELAKPCGKLHCCETDGRGSTFNDFQVAAQREFGLVNIAFLHHMIADFPLIDAYDYVFKIDADIRFLFTPKAPPEELMRAGHAVIMQSEVLEVGTHLHCVKPLVGVMDTFAAHHKLTVASKQHAWCEQMNLYLYGNFVGFWRPFVRAPAQRAFSRWLYENDPLLFNYNDQGLTRAFLCLWYDVPYLNSLPHVLDLFEWRGQVFTHP